MDDDQHELLSWQEKMVEAGLAIICACGLVVQAVLGGDLDAGIRQHRRVVHGLWP